MLRTTNPLISHRIIYLIAVWLITQQTYQHSAQNTIICVPLPFSYINFVFVPYAKWRVCSKLCWFGKCEIASSICLQSNMKTYRIGWKRKSYLCGRFLACNTEYTSPSQSKWSKHTDGSSCDTYWPIVLLSWCPSKSKKFIFFISRTWEW